LLEVNFNPALFTCNTYSTHLLGVLYGNLYVLSSTIEAEYMAVAEVAKEALWLSGLVKEPSIQQSRVMLYCDRVPFTCKKPIVSYKNQAH